jgi:hypothetical protein
MGVLLMIIRRIELAASKPVSIVAELTIEEAAQIANWTGSLSPASSPSPVETSAMYEALTGDLFNRFWDGGVDGYLNGDDE